MNISSLIDYIIIFNLIYFFDISNSCEWAQWDKWDCSMHCYHKQG